jgi:hypothetical protein
MQSCQCLANFRFQNPAQYRANWQDHIFRCRRFRRIKSAMITWAKACMGTPSSRASSRSSRHCSRLKPTLRKSTTVMRPAIGQKAYHGAKRFSRPITRLERIYLRAPGHDCPGWRAKGSCCVFPMLTAAVRGAGSGPSLESYKCIPKTSGHRRSGHRAKIHGSRAGHLASCRRVRKARFCTSRRAGQANPPQN